MPPTAQLQIDPSLLQRLKGIELKSRFLVRGLYNSRRRTGDIGASTEFVEHREYRKGDEIRRIDWRVAARTDRLFVKVHEMESDMKVHLVLDTSDSMRVPPVEGLPTKLELAAVISGALAVMAGSQQDEVGLLCVGERIAEHIPARQGTTHRALLFQHLADPPGGGGGRFGELVNEASARMGRRGMVFLLSDALDDLDALSSAVRNLAVREHDVTLIQILDRNEVEFPYDRMTEFRHPETGRRLVGDPSAIRSLYLERLANHQERVREICRKARTECLQLDTGSDLAGLLVSHLLRRLMTGGGR